MVNPLGLCATDLLLRLGADSFIISGTVIVKSDLKWDRKLEVGDALQDRGRGQLSENSIAQRGAERGTF
jgi:hypothetical protein